MNEARLEEHLADIREAVRGEALTKRAAHLGLTPRRTVLLGVVLVSVIFLLIRPSQQRSTIEVVTGTPAVTAAASGVAAAVVQFEETLPTDLNLPDIHVTAALVKELGEQDTLFSYRPRARWPIASLTKLLTAAVAMDELGPATIVTITAEAAETEGDSGQLKTGEKYAVNDLIRAMLTVSSNDAAVALAQEYDRRQLGDEVYAQALNKTALFTAKMQQRARELGMQETYFGDPSGLNMVNQSVVSDLGILMNYMASSHAELLETTRQKEATILERTRMTRHRLLNINAFAGQKDFLGGKTGFTEEAGQNLISLFNYGGKKYVIVVLGTEDRFGETQKLYGWLKGRVAVAPAQSIVKN
jgi:D-alanyl-D-alanine carboxypeptidase